MTALALPQPEYRALMMYSVLPEGCIAWQCQNEASLPHVKPGEWVVVDPGQRKPVLGELFVIKFAPRRSCEHICIVSQRPARFANSKPGDKAWMVGSVRNGEVSAALDYIRSMNLPIVEQNALHLRVHTEVGGWSEGPYGTEGRSYDHLCDCLMGMVIGIYTGPEGGAK